MGLEVWQECKQREIKIGQEIRKSVGVSFQDFGVRNELALKGCRGLGHVQCSAG